MSRAPRRVRGVHSINRARVAAVCIVMEQYEALMNVLELRGVNPAWPNGIISHVVGFTNHGTYVVDVWQSRRPSMLFSRTRLRPD